MRRLWRCFLFILALCPVLGVFPVMLTVYVITGAVNAAKEAFNDAVWVHGQFYDARNGDG